MKVLVTGASGFIGSHALPALARNGFEVVAASRKAPVCSSTIEWRTAPELGPDADWSATLREVDVVVHLAGRAHIGKKNAMEEALCLRINAQGTRMLARQAARHGVKHVVSLSSCHAIAAASDELLTAESEPRPSSAYGRSKLAAEEAVRNELEGTTCSWTIFRPPAVYGAGDTGNFGVLAKAVKSGLPLPFASVRNRRSFVYAGNLAEAIAVCAGNPKAFRRTFLPCDGEDVSTAELMRKIASAVAENLEGLGRKKHRIDRQACLFPFPEKLLRGAGFLPGFSALRKLTSSLYVDGKPLGQQLEWRPRFTMKEGLRRTLAFDS